MKNLSLVVVLLCGWGLAYSAVAQQTAAPDTLSAAPAEQLRQGRAAVEDGAPERAVALLRPLIEQQPAYTHPQHGAATYWLAEAHRAAGAPEHALQVSRAGLDALKAAGQFSVPLGDTYIHHALRYGTAVDYMRATDVYLQLIARVGTGADEPARSILRRHLRQAAVVLPSDLQQRVGVSVSAVMDVELHPTAEAGSLLVNWWRGQDVLPGTRENERLEEHLRRVAFAEQRYMQDGALDDRGLTYIRLGSPHHTTSVEFDDPHFRDKVIRRNPTLSRFDFPDNTFWSYDHLDPSAHYLFVEKDGRFEVSDTKALFPSYMRHGFSSHERGYRKAYSLVHTMEQVYRQLGMYHDDYMQRYADATDAAAVLDMREFAGEPITVARQSASDVGQTMLSDIEVQDARHRVTREERVPSSYSELLEETEPFPVHVRHARFLDDDGTTRTEFYWSTGVQALVPSDTSKGGTTDQYMVVTSATHRSGDYRERSARTNRQVINLKNHRMNGVLSPRTHTVRGDTGLYHLAMQWDEYRMTGSSGEQMGPLVKRNVYRADSLQALRPAPDAVAMSDLKPLTVPSDRSKQAALRLEDTIPYPFTTLSERTPLALYFEVYNLAVGAEDQTRYTVEYEVRRWHEEQGVWERIVGGDDAQVTTTQTTYTGNTRSTEEYIFLDQSQWDLNKEHDRLEIVVRVRDEHTGRETERSIRFNTVAAATP